MRRFKKLKKMNSQSVIIIIFILIKILVVNSHHAKAETNSSCFSDNILPYLSESESNYILWYNENNKYYLNPVYRCGKTNDFKDF